MANRLQIKGNFLRVFDDVSFAEFIRNVLTETTFKRSADDFSFFYKEPNVAGSDEVFVLGGDYTLFLYSDLIDDRTGLAFTSADELDDFLSENLGFFLKKSDESDVIFSSVVVQRTTALKLLDADPKRNGFTISNTQNLAILIRFKAAATDNNLEGKVLNAGDQWEDDNATYKGEISAIRLTATGGGTTITKSMQW